jgi:hypothetical protein
MHFPKRIVFARKENREPCYIILPVGPHLACAKSVFIVTSRIEFGLIAHLISPPARKLTFSGSVDAGKFL